MQCLQRQIWNLFRTLVMFIPNGLLSAFAKRRQAMTWTDDDQFTDVYMRHPVDNLSEIIERQRNVIKSNSIFVLSTTSVDG